MKAFVTGATGFLGRAVVRRLLAGGADVTCLVRPTSDCSPLQGLGGDGRLRYSAARLDDVDALAGAVRGSGLVFHLAAALTGTTSVLFLQNVASLRTIIAAMQAAGVKRLVLVSSLAVYRADAVRSGGTLDERTPLEPFPHRRDPYTFSKVAQEHVAWHAHGDGLVDLTVIRPGVIYGPGRDPITTRVGLRSGPVVVRFGGRYPLPYTYVDNCADAVALAGTAPLASGQAFNVVDPEMPSAVTLLREYRKAVGPVHVIPGRWALGALSRWVERYHVRSHAHLPLVLSPYRSRAMWTPVRYSCRKAAATLGWRPSVGPTEGLAATFGALRPRVPPAHDRGQP